MEKMTTGQTLVYFWCFLFLGVYVRFQTLKSRSKLVHTGTQSSRERTQRETSSCRYIIEKSAKNWFQTSFHSIVRESKALVLRVYHATTELPIKLICQKLEVDTKNPRPQRGSPRKGASKWRWVHFEKSIFEELGKINHQKIILQIVPTPIQMRLLESFPTVVSDPS